MANPWRERVLSYNRLMAEKKAKAGDMDALAAALIALPRGQLKHVLTDEIKRILTQYGYKE